MPLSRWILAAALCASSSMLAACGTPSASRPPLAAGPTDPVRPVALDPRLCADLQPEPEPAGAIVQPVTDEERFATAEHLDSDFDAREWGREGWKRAAIGKVECEKRK